MKYKVKIEPWGSPERKISPRPEWCQEYIGERKVAWDLRMWYDVPIGISAEDSFSVFYFVKEQDAIFFVLKWGGEICNGDN